jgi:hypothetical protein
MYNAKRLVAAISKRHPKQKTFYMDNPKNLKNAISTLVRTFGDESCEPSPGFPTPLRMLKAYPPIIIMMGAGNIVDYTKLLVSPK